MSTSIGMKRSSMPIAMFMTNTISMCMTSSGTLKSRMHTNTSTWQ